MIRTSVAAMAMGAAIGFAMPAEASIAIPDNPFVGKRAQASSGGGSGAKEKVINEELTENGTIFNNNAAQETFWVFGLDNGSGGTLPISDAPIVSLRIWVRHATSNVDHWLNLPTELEVRYSTASTNFNNHYLGNGDEWAQNWPHQVLHTTGLTTYIDPNPGQKFANPTSSQKWQLDETVFTNELVGVDTGLWHYADFAVNIPATATSIVLSFNSAQDGPYASSTNYSGTRIGAIQAVVPEPASLSILGLAGLSLLSRRRSVTA